MKKINEDVLPSLRRHVTCAYKIVDSNPAAAKQYLHQALRDLHNLTASPPEMKAPPSLRELQEGLESFL